MAFNDSNTTLQELKERALKFRNDRDWGQFHTPKNIAMALAVEASELLELFLWKTDKEINEQFKRDAKFRQDVLDELADVVHDCLAFANNIEGFDVTSAFIEKLEKTAQKYPVEKAKGRSDKYTKL